MNSLPSTNKTRPLEQRLCLTLEISAICYRKFLRFRRGPSPLPPPLLAASLYVFAVLQVQACGTESRMTFEYWKKIFTFKSHRKAYLFPNSCCYRQLTCMWLKHVWTLFGTLCHSTAPYKSSCIIFNIYCSHRLIAAAKQNINIPARKQNIRHVSTSATHKSTKHSMHSD